MDYYNFNPNIADSLGILSPAAQRNSRLYNRRFLPYHTCAEDLRFTRHNSSFNQRCQRQSSTSLILKKTRDREIVEEYCNENIRYRPYPYPKPSKQIQAPKHRPLIKVTVIPNNNNTGTQTKLRNHCRPGTKKIQSSVSNHESYFKAKNIFLVVAGNKREKVYKIKTTGSEYSNSTRYVKDEEIPVEHNFKQLLSSLNMDKKKKKDKSKGKKEKDKKKEVDYQMEEKISGTSLLNIMEGCDSSKEPMLRDCICSPPIDTVSPRKSRVRITGKIGLTEDDRYVLKCAATIDGKPVETNFFQEQNRSPSPEWQAQETREIPKICVPCPGERIVYCQRENITMREQKVSQRDEIIQTNIQFEDSYRQMYPFPTYINTCPAFRSVETQCSPNNMNSVCFSNIEKLKIYSNKDQVVQCNCPQDLIFNSNNVGTEADYDKNPNIPKNCNSPLVIISVYPKQDSDEKFEEEKISIKEPNIRPPSKEKGNGNKKGEKPGKKKQGKGSRAASPTPSKSPVKAKDEKKPDKPKGKVKGEKPVKGNKKGPKKEKAGQEEKEESKSPDRKQSEAQNGIAVGRCAECCMGCVGRRVGQDSRKSGPSFNTKRIMNWVSAKNDVSNVAINIDGENEFYDVLFRQGDITTDLQVRKTVKEVQGLKQDNTDGGSLENFFLLPDDQGRTRKRSFSQTFIIEHPKADTNETVEQTIPRLHVRDSIEISHRREERDSCDSMTITSTASSSNGTSKSKLDTAPVKHFQGDNCKLPNPVERDKEIRELLGIEKPHFSRTYEEFSAKAETDHKRSLHCLYRRQRRTNVSTIQNIHEINRFYMDDAVTQATDDDDVEYIDEELEEGYYNNGYNYIEGNYSNVNIAHDQEYLPIHFECSDSDNCPNKKYICEHHPLIKTSTNNIAEPNEALLYHPGRSQVSELGFNLCSNPCNMAFQPSVYSPPPRKMCVPKDPKRPPCGFVEQCRLKQPIDEDILEKQDVEYPPETYKQQNTIRNPCTPCIQPYNQNDDPYRREPSLFLKPHAQGHECKKLCDLNENPPLCQQLILNRNINIYLQIEQFTKQKPIILSRKQYDKVKRTIECATAKKINCICKSSRHSNGEVMKRSSLFTSSANKCIQCQVDDGAELHKDWKKYFIWDKKGKKSKDNFLPDKEHDSSYCYRIQPSNINYVSSSNHLTMQTQILKSPSNKLIVNYSKSQIIPTQTNKPKSNEKHSTNNYEAVKKYEKQTKLTSLEKSQLESDKMFQESDHLILRKPDEDETENYFNEKRNNQKTKFSRSDRVETDNHEEEIQKHSKRKASKLHEKETKKHGEEQKQKPKKDHHTKKTKLKEEGVIQKEKDVRKKTTGSRCGGGDESLERKKSVTEHKRKKREKLITTSIEPQLVGIHEVETMKDDNKVPTTENGSRKPKPIPTSEVTNGLHHCKRCGRIKQLHPCGKCGRMNGACLHTCYCYEVKKDNSHPSVENIFINDFVKNKQYAASSTEVRYTSVIYANYKHVTFPPKNVADENVPSVTNVLMKNYNSNSLHTIFKGRRKTPTPNLGTSAYSLYSEYSDATSSAKPGIPERPMQERKPFLRRLMSCLVMRSKTSNVKIDNVKPKPKEFSANSSLDSYHINTSLGAIELSSSIYDTTASFYSNHSIQPINSKIIKRGFLSSVRGFLSTRKT